jgi:large subunit ribosomal protein L24
MKSGFATSWKSSVQPRKQRKYQANAPLHLKGKFLAATLSKDLRAKHNTRSVRVRTGDKVKVLRGQFKGKEGAVDRVSLKDIKLYIEGVELTKPEGGKIKYPVHPSNVMILSLKNETRRFKEHKKASKGTEK